MVFAGLAGYAVYKGWQREAAIAWGAASALTAVVTLFAPRLLAPFNRVWYLLGELLGRIVSPIVMGVIFFGLITPVALFGRLRGRDELRMRRRTVSSHWIDRDPPGPAADSFKNQF
ncbi:MAG: hypothetical protein GY848_01735 [Methyloversatilis sp.]|nr:hypothetical protein [Methyloversatilis sp.]